MNATIMAKKLSERTGIPVLQTKVIVNHTIDILREALVEGDLVKIPNTMTIWVKDMPARMYRHFQSGEQRKSSGYKKLAVVTYDSFKDKMTERWK